MFALTDLRKLVGNYNGTRPAIILPSAIPVLVDPVCRRNKYGHASSSEQSFRSRPLNKARERSQPFAERNLLHHRAKTGFK
jgi:hypothetical protein